MRMNGAALAMGLLLLAGCSASAPSVAPAGIGPRPVPPSPIPEARAIDAGGWRPYAASPSAEPRIITEPVTVGRVESRPLTPVGTPEGSGVSRAIPPGWNVGPAPAAQRPEAPDTGLSVPKAAGSSGDRAPGRTRPYAASSAGVAAAPLRNVGPRPYTPPPRAAVGGFRVRSDWADGAVPSADREAFEAAVRAAAAGGDGSWTAADGETFAASRVVGAPGRCVAVEILGSRAGQAGITRRGSAEACPR